MCEFRMQENKRVCVYVTLVLTLIPPQTLLQ